MLFRDESLRAGLTTVKGFPKFFSLAENLLQGKGIHPAGLSIECEPAFIEVKGLVLSDQLAEAIECGFEGAVRQVALGIRPDGVAQLFLLHVPAAESDEGLEQE